MRVSNTESVTTDTKHTDKAIPTLKEQVSASEEIIEGCLANETNAVPLIVVKLPLRVNGKDVVADAMLDTGATSNFMDNAWAKRHGVSVHLKENPTRVRTIDGRPVRGGVVRYETESLETNGLGGSTPLRFTILPKSTYSVVLGMPWFESVNPVLDWQSREVSVLTKTADGGLEYQNQGKGHTDSRESMKVCETQMETVTLGDDMDLSPDTNRNEKIVTKYYQEFGNLFDKNAVKTLPKHSRFDHVIKLEPNAVLPVGRVYNQNGREAKIMRDYLDDMLDKGFIRQSTSPTASPGFLVPKKDEPNGRFVVDYRAINKITIKDRTPLPLINETFDRLTKGKIFSQLDLRGAYNLLRMAEGEEWKTAFRTRYGLFEYLVMPFGLTNAPATFQAMVNEVLREYLDVFVVVYLDDILVYSESEAEHIQHVRKVLQKLSEHNLYVKLEKCRFHVDVVMFLGYVLSPKGMKMDPGKVDAVQNWKPPENKKALQRFLGFANYYRRFIHEYSRMTRPLNNLTKDVPYVWTSEQQSAFDDLKKRFVSAPVLLNFREYEPVYLETDASNVALGCVLSQKDSNGFMHPVAYFSRSFTPAEHNYDIHDKELLAIVTAFKEWRPWLAGAVDITVFTDHRNLLYFFQRQDYKQRHWRWREELSFFNYRIQYREGRKQGLSDALSRREEFSPDSLDERITQQSKPLLDDTIWTESSSPSSTTEKINILEDEIDDVEPLDTPPELIPIDPDDQVLIDQLSRGHTKNKEVIYKDGKIVVPDDPSLRKRIISSRHDAKLAGHRGISKTVQLVQRHYAWDGLRKEVEAYVKSCDICARTKRSLQKPAGLLQPLPIADRPWSSVSMDFIMPLPESNGFDAILVVVDRLTKMAHFIPTNATIDVEGLARVFLDNVIRLHGVPVDIVSDRGSVFVSNLWSRITNQLGISRKLSTAYHPQTDGQTERVNQILEQYIRTYCNYQQNNWENLLSTAEFSYNNAESETTKTSPFEANYGYSPLMDLETGISNRNPQVVPLLQTIRDTHRFVKQEIRHAQARYKRHADKHRRQGPEFSIGDMVWLSTDNIKTTRPMKKLDHQWIGPYPVTRSVGGKAFELGLPAGTRIYNVFHPSRLRKVDPSILKRKQSRPEPTIIEGDKQYDVNAILDCRRSGKSVKYLVDWEGYDVNDRTWEPFAYVVQDVPQLIKEFHQQNPHKPKPKRLDERLAEISQ